MKAIAIIHFSPLEIYPPIQNLLIEFKAKHPKKSLVVLTTKTNVMLDSFNVISGQIKILHLGRSGKNDMNVVRYLNYIWFYASSLAILLWIRPGKVLYVETLSSFPACMYKKLMRSRVEILAHYHEYTAPHQYASGMKLERFFHQIELKMYSQFAWVSHTNEMRMAKFQADIYPVQLSRGSFHILPNFPPKHWIVEPSRNVHQPLKIVYVGALSLDTMFTREFAQWIINRNGSIVWDIYSHNITMGTRAYFQNLNSDWIRVKGGVAYDRLPAILTGYDVGVILYNGHIPNYVYNAPNKLFEYLACGLEVIFPNVMTGSLPFIRNEGFPRVVTLDFAQLEEFDHSQLQVRGGEANKFIYSCEEALAPLLEKLTANG